MEEKRNLYKMLVGNGLFGRFMIMWEDNIKILPNEIGCGLCEQSNESSVTIKCG
jgi:hypothetical protein